ncbi:MAG: DKNYY domain-containing protein [Planctomycetales bacterium]|nr:DKNYY domain-containing protein [Planctomycetales bacterium]
MKFLGTASVSAVVALLMLTGCSEDARQAAPHVVVGAMAEVSGASKGFFVTDGQPTYHDWNAGFGNIIEPLEGAHAASFHAFAQPKNAMALFARDRKHVYMAVSYTPREITGADAKSFSLITNDGLYAKDAKHVYFLGVPILEANPLTFEVLMYPFSQDKEDAFIGAAPIPNVDRESWRPLREGWADDCWERSANVIRPKPQESIHVNGWSRDANAFYYGREAISGIDVATFEVLSDYYAKDKNNVYSQHYGKLVAIKNADASTFVVHEDAEEILGRPRGADAHDANSQYRDGKVFNAN